ncbi:TetR/AcrR family transcriptional regulator [Paractinoplanes ferrugineus]|uniref:TetR family transcriptional regulator n=1 Tax=Paractinoplanes ferrugineus TaxID=113564 RepID=A0A919MJJ1_9ACTN|nr:helix-turn-helix domain-containing protein [Actinoplanes ferrugineus]GIE10217.1 TetR family transcriptional regulator [Actinoplanes ferrugineus]
MSSQSDLTARARIRDAAIDLFADRGIARATIRDIALEAGVSSGLLRHHFGSKEGLRDACDEFSVNELAAAGARFIELPTLDRVRPEWLRMQRYLLASLADGSPTAEALFDRLVDYGEQWLRSTDLDVPDPRAWSAVMCVMKMSLFTMSAQLSRVLGTDVTEPAGWARMLAASVDIFSKPLVTPEQAEQLREAVARFRFAAEGEQS